MRSSRSFGRPPRATERAPTEFRHRAFAHFPDFASLSYIIQIKNSAPRRKDSKKSPKLVLTDDSCSVHFVSSIWQIGACVSTRVPKVAVTHQADNDNFRQRRRFESIPHRFALGKNELPLDHCAQPACAPRHIQNFLETLQPHGQRLSKIAAWSFRFTRRKYDTEITGERIHAAQEVARRKGKSWGGSEKGRSLNISPSESNDRREFEVKEYRRRIHSFFFWQLHPNQTTLDSHVFQIFVIRFYIRDEIS